MTILDEAFSKIPTGAHLALLGEYGSAAHGVNMDTSDHDFTGVAVEPKNAIYGLESYEHTLLGKDNQNARTAAEADEGKVFGLKKWTRLIEAGNTDVMASLFLPSYLHISEVGEILLENRSLFVSHQAIQRFAGHLSTERRRMNGGDAKVKVLRPDLIEQYGFDTKAAYQAVKLGFHGLRIAREGVMSIPFPREERDYILNVRLGKTKIEDIDEFLDETILELDSIQPSEKLPDRPDREKINSLLERIYRIVF